MIPGTFTQRGVLVVATRPGPAPVAASSLPSKAAVRRLVTVTLAGLRAPPAESRHGR